MLSNNRGYIAATHYLCERLKHFDDFFDEVIAEAQTEQLPEWGNFNPSTIKPVLFRMEDAPPQGPMQAKTPAMVLSITNVTRDGNAAAIQAQYAYTLTYIYSSPQVEAFQDAPLVACQLAYEALIRCLKSGGAPAGHGPRAAQQRGLGVDFSTSEISQLYAGVSTVPNWTRFLTITIKVTNQENY